MQKREFKKPNFSIDRTRRGDLAKQIAFGLSTAIETGYYRPGDILPPVRDLAEILGVSMGIAVQAVNKIHEAGLISPRPAVGSVVCAPDRPLWKGQVLVVSPSGGTQHYMNAVCATLCDALASGGYLALTVTVPQTEDGNFDFSLLDLMTRQHVDLIVQLYDEPEITGWLSARKIPFARLTVEKGKRLPAGCVGVVRRSNATATAEFAAHCREAGVKSVLVATAWNRLPVAPVLHKAGVRTKRWHFDMKQGTPGAVVAQHAFDAMSVFLAKQKGILPDLVFFDDDFLAMGALAAMLHAGVRIPEDVGFVALANRFGGSGMAFAVPITRMEVDSHADGRILSDAVLSYLGNGDFPSGITVGPKYVKGGTLKHKRKGSCL